jgi:CheY-like chemotaxis protein
VRVLLVEDNRRDAAAIQRELNKRFELRVVGSLQDAVTLLRQGNWQPDVVLTDLELPDAEGLAILHGLQAAAPGIPVLVSTGAMTETLRRQLDVLSAIALPERQTARSKLQHAQLHHGQLQSLAAYRSEMIAEIDRITRHAADAAVARAFAQLLDRLGLEDEEGLRMAIRLARGWEAAKHRFVSAMTTGLASALLLAIGAGVVAMIRHGGSK